MNGPDPFSREVAVVPSDAPLFDYLSETLPGGRQIRQAIHDRELERAAQPPVINVTVTDPDGMPRPGHFRVDLTRPQPEVHYLDRPAPSSTEPLHYTRDALEALRRTA